MIPSGIRFLANVFNGKKHPIQDHSEEFKHLMRMKKDELFVLAAEHDCEIPPAATKKTLSKLIINKKSLDK